MARSSCIRHPENEPLIIIREWQVIVCERNTCAASLLSFFEYWHSIRLEMGRKARHANVISGRHGDVGNQDEGLVQFHTAEDLVRGLMGLYKADTIRSSIKYLVQRGFMRQFRNPNPRYAFDKTWHFIFCVDAVRSALDSYLLSIGGISDVGETKTEERSQINHESLPKNPSWCVEDRLPSAKDLTRSLKTPAAIPEITTEISSESYSSSVASLNTITVNDWPRPEEIFRDLEFLHGVDPAFAELQFVEFRSWWREKGKLTQGEWDSKFLQRCADKWDSRLVRQQAMQKGR